MIRRTASVLAVMGLILVGTSGIALAQDEGACAAGTCWSIGVGALGSV
jgi:hypothetical protein